MGDVETRAPCCFGPEPSHTRIRGAPAQRHPPRESPLSPPFHSPGDRAYTSGTTPYTSCDRAASDANTAAWAGAASVEGGGRLVSWPLARAVEHLAPPPRLPLFLWYTQAIVFITTILSRTTGPARRPKRTRTVDCFNRRHDGDGLVPRRLRGRGRGRSVGGGSHGVSVCVLAVSREQVGQKLEHARGCARPGDKSHTLALPFFPSSTRPHPTQQWCVCLL